MKYLILFFSAFICFTSCETKSDNEQYDPTETINNVITNIILPNYEALATDAALLKENIDVLKNDITESNLTTVQNNFSATYQSYQKVSMFEFGPATDEALSTLNIYPTDDDKINNNILNGNYNLEAASNMVATGLPALDYLLFHDTKTNIVAQLADTDYLDYLVAVAEQLANKTSNVNNTWKNSYSNTFMASTGTSAGSSISVLTNAFILDFEKNGREGKIGIPAGVRTLNEAIPTNVETYYSGNSILLAKTHMEAIISVYQGTGSQNFKVLLIDSEKEDLANNISTQFTSIQSSLNTLTDPFSDMLISSNQPAISTYAEYQKLIPLLKVDMTSALNLLITYSDSDGD